MFKKLLVVFAMLSAFGCSSCASSTPQPQPIPPVPSVVVKVPETITWHEASPATLDLAVKQEKGLLLFVTSETCKWCALMKDKTFKNQEIIDRINMHFVCMEVVAEKEPELAAALLEESIYPTTLFSISEKVEGTFVAQGYVNNETMMQILDKMDEWREIQKALNKTFGQ